MTKKNDSKFDQQKILPTLVMWVATFAASVVQIIQFWESDTRIAADVLLIILFVVLCLGIIIVVFNSSNFRPIAKTIAVALPLLTLLILGAIRLWQGNRGLVTFGLILLGILSISHLQEINVFLSSRMRYKTLIGQVVIFSAIIFGILYPIFYQAQSPDRFVVLVANFENTTSPNHDDNYDIKRTLRDALRKATSEYDDIEIKAIDRSFSEESDVDAAARKYRASFIIWGWYTVQDYSVYLSLKFASISVLGAISAGERTKLTEIELQEDLSREMIYLSLFFAGMFQNEKGNPDTAITLYSEALNKSAEIKSASKLGQAVIHWFRGAAYYDKKNYDQAIEDFSQSIKLDLNDVYTYKWYLWRGFVYSERGNYQQAIEDLSSALRLLPNFGNAYLTRGNAYLSNRDYDKAIADFNKAIEFHNKPIDFLPVDEHIYFDRGAKWAFDQISGDFNQAIRFINEPRILAREDAEIYADRGRAYFAKGDYDQAIMDFDYAIRFNPHHANSYSWYNWRGYIFAFKGDTHRAIADYNKAISLKPDIAELYLNRGNAFYHIQEYDWAIYDYGHARELAPQDAENYLSLGRAYLAKRDYDQAFECYDRAKSLSPDNVDAGQYRDIAYYSKLVDIHSDDADAYFRRGIAYERLGIWDLALEDYIKTIELKPDFSLAYMGRGNAYYYFDKYDQAISDYDQAIKLKLNIAGVFRNRGLCYTIKKDYESAIADFSRAINLDQNFAAVYYDRGCAYMQIGFEKEAIADFQKVLELSSASNLRTQAENRLKTILGE